MEITVDKLFKIAQTDLRQYKLHLACWNKYEHPLNVYLNDWEKWVDWNQWRGNKNDFNRQYIFSLIQFHHEPGKWLFGGVFKVVETLANFADTSVGYRLELVDLHKDLIGRLIIDFQRTHGRGRAFLLEKHYNQFSISEILKSPYDGVNFPGYENININFPELEMIFKVQKTDWKGALENVKGVYVICDKSNGKKYVGSAYGDLGIWSRWKSYIETGHGSNEEFSKVMAVNGIEYARKNFRFSLLEFHSRKSDDVVIINRESFWKEVLLTRGQFGYNKN